VLALAEADVSQGILHSSEALMRSGCVVVRSHHILAPSHGAVSHTEDLLQAFPLCEPQPVRRQLEAWQETHDVPTLSSSCPSQVVLSPAALSPFPSQHSLLAAPPPPPFPRHASPAETCS
jgi:hypothetical protein